VVDCPALIVNGIQKLAEGVTKRGIKEKMNLKGPRVSFFDMATGQS
jgi:hypothetical protein